MEIAFQCGGHHLVLHDVFAVKLNSTDSVLQVLLPNQLVLTQIENFEVAVVVTRCDAAFFVVERIAESNLNAYATAQQSTTTSSLPTTGSKLKTGDF